MTEHDPITPTSPHTLDQLLTAIPYQLGFHPSDCLVAVLTNDSVPELVLRCELDEPRLGTNLAQFTDRLGLTLSALIAYTPLDSAATTLQTIGRDLTRAGIGDCVTAQANRGHYRLIGTGTSPSTPTTWRPFEPDTGIQTAMQARGREVLPSRQALIDQLAPGSGADRDSMREVTAAVEQNWAARLADDPDSGRDLLRTVGLAHLSHLDKHISADPGHPVELSDVGVAEYGICLHDPAVVLTALTLTATDPGAYRTVWVEVMRRVSRDHLAAPATLAAYACWMSGNSMTAQIAVNHALDVDPDYLLAARLHTALRSQIGFELLLDALHHDDTPPQQH